MGESDSYYNPNPQGDFQGQQPPLSYQQQQPPPPLHEPYPPQNQYQGGGYNGQGERTGYDEKPSFEQTFKIEKPKWNDLWAGVLVGSNSPPTMSYS